MQDDVSLQDQHDDHMPLYTAKAVLDASRVDRSCGSPSIYRDAQDLVRVALKLTACLSLG